MIETLDDIAYLDLVAEDVEYAMAMNFVIIDVIAGEEDVIDV